MTQRTPIRLTRPSFWPEPRSPETWLRALDQLATALGGSTPKAYSPRSLWEQHLRRRLSMRSVPGLFGVEGDRLLGAGFLTRDAEDHLCLDPSAETVLEPFRRKATHDALAALGRRVLHASVALRVLLIRLARGDWQITRDGGGRTWELGRRLTLATHAKPEEWCRGIEADCLGTWAGRFPDLTSRCIRPDLTATNPSHRFGWGPLEAPLYLLDSLGWLRADGRLTLPNPLAEEPLAVALRPVNRGPGAVLRRLTEEQADVRGLVPVEPVLRSLRSELGERELDPASFATWMDRLCAEAARAGAIEIEASEPGQSRHGRGLQGDRRRQLVRWQIHEAFNDIYARHAVPEGTSDGGDSR